MIEPPVTAGVTGAGNMAYGGAGPRMEMTDRAMEGRS